MRLTVEVEQHIVPVVLGTVPVVLGVTLTRQLVRRGDVDGQLCVLPNRLVSLELTIVYILVGLRWDNCEFAFSSTMSYLYIHDIIFYSYNHIEVLYR